MWTPNKKAREKYLKSLDNTLLEGTTVSYIDEVEWLCISPKLYKEFANKKIPASIIIEVINA